MITVIEPDTSKFAYTIREPIGVCALIVAWNYPLVNLVWKMAPAIAAGNTVIIKPAQQTPLSALYFANLVKEAGIPAGVVNILNGAGRLTGSCLVEHPGVNMVSFTGSTPVAMDIMARAAKTLKPVTLEAGGKSPLIVFDDADLVQAARWAHAGIMSNQGQICSATSRLVVHHSVFDEFVAELKQTIKSRSRIGNPFLAETFQGPQVTRNQYNQILSYIKSGKEEGATLVMGGNVYHEPSGKGLYIEPTIFTDVLPSMTIFQEEIFGPVVVVTKFSTEAEAIELANDTQYGLAAAVFTTNNSRAHAVARQIEAGSMINLPVCQSKANHCWRSCLDQFQQRRRLQNSLWWERFVWHWQGIRRARVLGIYQHEGDSCQPLCTFVDYTDSALSMGLIIYKCTSSKLSF